MRNKYFGYDVILLALFSFFMIIYNLFPFFDKLVPVNLDIVTQNHPSYDFVKSAYFSRNSFFWNPHIVCGYPLIAMPYVLFNWKPYLFMIIGLKNSLAVDFIVRLLVYTFFMNLFLKRLKLSKFAALTGTVLLTVVTVSAYVKIYDFYLIYLFPALIYFTEKVISEKKITSALWLSIILVFSFFTGHPQYNLYFCYSLVLYILAKIYFNRQGYKKTVILFIAAFILAFILSFSLIFPVYEMTKFSNRSIGLSWFESGLGSSLHPRQLLGLILPNFFGNYYNLTEWGGRNYGLSIYLSIPGLFFLLYALRKIKRNYFVCFFVFLGLFSVLLGFGIFTPIYHVLYNLLPGFKLFRGADRILYLFIFSAAVISAFGADYFIKVLAENKQLPLRIKKYLFMIVFFATIMLLTSIFFKALIFKFGEFMISSFFLGRHGHPYGADYYMSKLSAVYYVNLAGLIKIVFVAVSIYWVISIYSKKRNVNFLKGSILAVIFLDLISAPVTFDKQFPAILMGDGAVYSYTPVCIRWLNHDSGDFRIMTLGGSVPANLSMRYGLYNVKGYEALYIGTYYNFWSKRVMKDRGQDRDFTEVWASLIGFDERERITDYNRDILDLLGVKYILSPVEITDETFKLVFVAEEPANRKPLLLPNDTSNLLLLKYRREGNSYYPDTPVYSKRIYIYENKSVLPRAFLVDRYVKAINGDDALNKLKRPDFEFRKAVILENAGNISLLTLENKDSAGSATIVNYSTQKIELLVDATRDCFLVFTDSWYPGWKAYLDNKETKIYKADAVFRAVSVPAGSHRVRFVYIPMLFYIGLVISLLTLITIVLFTVIRFIVNLKNK